jgi:hypothetical protein
VIPSSEKIMADFVGLMLNDFIKWQKWLVFLNELKIEVLLFGDDTLTDQSINQSISSQIQVW